MPDPGLIAGDLQHVLPELDDLARALGVVDERVRWQQAALGVLPPRQCFDADHDLIGELNDRLVMNDELAVGRRLLDLCRHSGVDTQAGAAAHVFGDRPIDHDGTDGPTTVVAHQRGRPEQLDRGAVTTSHGELPVPPSLGVQLPIGAHALPFGSEPGVDFVQRSADDLGVVPSIELLRGAVEALDAEVVEIRDDDRIGDFGTETERMEDEVVRKRALPQRESRRRGFVPRDTGDAGSRAARSTLVLVHVHVRGPQQRIDC